MSQIVHHSPAYGPPKRVVSGRIRSMKVRGTPRHNHPLGKPKYENTAFRAVRRSWSAKAGDNAGGKSLEGASRLAAALSEFSSKIELTIPSGFMLDPSWLRPEGSDQNSVKVVNPDKSFISSRNQQTLGLPGAFSPSTSLISFWHRGLCLLGAIPPSGFDNLKEASATNIASMKLQFAKDLSSVIGEYAYRRSEGHDLDLPFTERRRIAPQLQVDLCEKFYVVPDESPQFLSRLQRELRFGLEVGCDISGNWGALYLTATEMRLRISSQTLLPSDGFIVSTEVE